MDRRKQTFTKPEVDLIVFDKKDIITASIKGSSGRMSEDTDNEE